MEGLSKNELKLLDEINLVTLKVQPETVRSVTKHTLKAKTDILIRPGHAIQYDETGLMIYDLIFQVFMKSVNLNTKAVEYLSINSTAEMYGDPPIDSSMRHSMYIVNEHREDVSNVLNTFIDEFYLDLSTGKIRSNESDCAFDSVVVVQKEMKYDSEYNLYNTYVVVTILHHNQKTPYLLDELSKTSIPRISLPSRK